MEPEIPENGSEVERLYICVPKTDVEKGLSAKGWIPDCPVIAGFDPKILNPKKIMDAFAKEGQRVLVEIIDTFYKSKFSPRVTGPDKRYQGVLATSLDYIPPGALKAA